ncbi:hypothetical protein WKI13_02465 [Teredinibacter turnerae]|uniref:hypothetical protein n=1 Tax=Teredinibacter turnerae TaxID=2426 RepID=UPI0003726761|nr:hypothetical protein [Teredinibacter turnerae]
MLSTLITILAVIVAFLAAIHARKSAEAAKEANKIAVHQNRLEIYKSLVLLISALSSRGPDTKSEDIWQFYEPAELSKFYFCDQSANRISLLFDNLLRFLSKKHDWQVAREEGSDNLKQCAREMHASLEQCRDEAVKVKDEIEPQLIVNKA